MKKNFSNKSEKRTRRDFLASGIAGITGSTLLAEQMARGQPLQAETLQES